MKRSVLLSLSILPFTIAAATGAVARPAAQPTQMPSVLRVAYKAMATAACGSPGANTPANLASLARHLSNRLQLSVQLCPFADPAAAATALAQGKVDFASLTPAAWPLAKGKGRPILTVRPDGKLPRTPIFAIARKSAGKLDAAAIAQEHVVLIHQDPLAYDAARAAVATRGGTAITRTPTPVAGSFDAAIGMLSAGKADVALVPANQWTTGCLEDKALCAPYAIAWQNRPLAESAWVLRDGLPNELHYRLIGIFLAMRLENAQAYAGASDGVKGAFEPTESAALDGGAGQ